MLLGYKGNVYMFVEPIFDKKARFIFSVTIYLHLVSGRDNGASVFYLLRQYGKFRNHKGKLSKEPFPPFS